ncbi:hypothetical protein [Rhizobium mongolense]|uniref:Uncharacterized protein n=1 Tax=Rhizobium mongolense TaxID=57676 RepID=A0A7W6RQC0_9HYPH|nr:hypothetical protein [Rhizobium mongolense]MBB4276599.1 hypothetical protein [Rhizobium mongolense]
MVTSMPSNASLDAMFANMRDYRSLASRSSTNVQAADLGLELSNARATFKLLVSQVSMHLGIAWLHKLFSQIDSLLDLEEWDPRDPPPKAETARTFIRMLLVLKVARKPGLGISNSGNLIAAWTTGPNRLTVECFPNDRVRWVLTRHQNSEVERAAGEGKIDRLKSFIAPYDPSVWFEYGEQLPA